MFWYIVYALVLGGAYYLWKKKKGKSKKPDHTGGPCDNTAAKPLSCPPGNGNPLFTGLRVVELCEVVATPVCCRMLADMGADVIKVERPGKGDLARTLLAKELERERPFGSAFDACNTSKRSIIMDIKKTTDFLKFKKLLKDADVLVTNTRYPALKKLGLTYEQIKDEFPGLIYAHLSAFGTTGPSATEPGFDTTAFWVGTGLSNSVHRQGNYHYYPAGFGDAMAGSILFSGICTALRAKYETGVGTKVDTSLFKCGLFCQSAVLCNPPEPERKTPVYQNVTSKVSPLCGSYECKDMKYMHIGPPVSQRDAAVEKLAKIIPDAAGKSGEDLYNVIADKLKTMDVKAAVKMISEAGVDCVEHNHSNLFPVVQVRDNERFSNAKAWMKGFATDVQAIPHLPFDCHASDKHVARCRAPYHGQHTDDILANDLENAWFPRDDEAVIKTTSDASMWNEGMPLGGIKIVEWSDDGVAASTATMFAADLGATVIKVEPEGGDCWRKVHPEFFETMNRGKKSIVTDDIMSLLADADMFVTNRSMSELKSKGLDPTSLSEKLPKLIYGLVTPRGREGSEDIRNDYLIWYGESGMCNCMNPKPPGCPPQLGSLMTGTHLWAGLSAALFHRDRTGEGQLVDTNQYRCTAFGGIFLTAFLLHNPGFEDFASKDPADCDRVRYFFALASFACYKTKDGVWINLIGPDLLGDCKKLITTLGLWTQILKGVFPFLYKFATTKGSLFLKLRTLGQFLIPLIEKKIGEYTLDEITKIFEKGNVWFCKVGVADQMAYHPQVKFLDLLAETEKGNRILRCPLSVGGLEEISMSAPTL